MTRQVESARYETKKTAQDIANALVEVRDGNFVGIDVVEKKHAHGFSPEAKQLLLRAILREEPRNFSRDVSVFVHVGRDTDPNETILCENPSSEKFTVTLGLPEERHLKPAQISPLS